MSDRSSESSCEWVLLKENDDLVMENTEVQPTDLKFNYDSISLIASESMKSSLSVEELEWQYDLLGDNSNLSLSPYDLSYIEDLDSNSIEGADFVPAEDIYINDCSSLKDFKENIDLNLGSVHKIHCYKHNRNDRLNFALNIMLLVAVSSALGLGIGHFVGWSRRSCTNTNAFISRSCQYALPVKAVIKQTMESLVPKEKGIKDSPVFSENFQNTFEISKLALQENCEETLPNNIVTNVNTIIENVLRNADILEIPGKNVNLSNSDLEDPLVLNSVLSIDWSKISQITIPVKTIDDNLSDFGDEAAINEDLIVQNREINMKSDFLKPCSKKDEDLKEINFTKQLQEDLIQVVQTLNAIASTRLSDRKEKFSSFADLEQIQKSFGDFQSIIMSKITFIEDFIQSAEYKTYSKLGINHLKKMVYSLVDSFDYFMKSSLRMFGKDIKQINIYKFLKNMSKIIFNFDKKWQKNQNIWAENLERIKNQEMKQKSFRDFKHKSFQQYKEKPYEKETKHWKRKAFADKDLKQKYDKYSMKS